MEVTLLIAFLSGIIIGVTPCILLMLSAFGSSLIMHEDKSKFLTISIGLLSGMILAYILISVLFIFIFQFLVIFMIFTIFRYIFAGILIFIGIWQIIECKKEKSIIFGTPEKVKSVLKDFIEKRSGIYAFFVGIIFVFIKIPCFGLIYLALLYNLYGNPLLIAFIIVYLIGMIIPIIIVLILLRFFIESSKLNEFRERNRVYFRILNGAILIFLAIYLLFLEHLIHTIIS